MKKKDRNILLWIGGIALLLIAIGTGSHIDILKTFIPQVEDFSKYPVWDVKQWSWGYGTAAGYDKNHKPAGSITKEQAMQEALKVLQDHYKYLAPVITRKLNGKQWAALLSFSYNVGPGDADNLVPNINSMNDQALFNQWKKYVYANGIKSNGLVNRRNKEIALWQS